MTSSTRDKAVGTGKINAVGVKSVAGRVLGNPQWQAGGKADQAEGQIQKKIGDIKKVLGN